ncbi:hypothetical protein E4U42_002072, partial [Claviceps africana]
MESYQNALKAFVDEGEAPSFAIVAKRRDGEVPDPLSGPRKGPMNDDPTGKKKKKKINIEKIGSDILHTYVGGPTPDWPDQRPVDKDTIFALASLTKLPTTVAVLQLVERKLIALDTDVTKFLPVLGRQKILTGWAADGSPILRERREPITLRQLLTHSSGCGYDWVSPKLKRFRRWQGTTAATKRATMDEWFDQPLVLEPGRGWEYGCGVDWAGRLVEQISGLDLEEYMRRHIWRPLGCSSFTFWPHAPGRRPDVVATYTERDPGTGRLGLMPKGLDINENVTECFGGHSGFCSASDFAELMLSLLANDERLLEPSSVDLMFQDQSTPESREYVQVIMDRGNFAVGDYHAGEVYTWGLGGVLIEETRDSKAPYDRRPGTLG